MNVKIKLKFSAGFLGGYAWARLRKMACSRIWPPDHEIPVDGGALAFQLKPYQLMTFHCKDKLEILSLSVE